METNNKKLDIIISMMDDSSPTMRYKAILKYAETQQHKAEELLLNNLNSTKIDTDIACYIKALTSISSYASSSAIFDFKEHKNEIIRLEVLKYVNKNYIASYDEFLISSLNDNSISIRLEALNIIGELKLYSAVSEVLVATVVSVSSQFIKHAKKVLIDMLSKYPNDNILMRIRDFKPSLQKNSYTFLTHDNDSAALEFSQVIRDSILYTLIDTPDLKCINLLKDIFKNCINSKRVINALYALNMLKIDITVADLLNKIFIGDDDTIKVEIIKSLKDSRDDSWIPILFENFASLDRDAKIEAVIAVKEIQNQKTLNVLIDELLSCDIDDKRYMDVLLGSIGKYDTNKVLKPVLMKIKERGYLSSTVANNLRYFKYKETGKIVYPFLGSSNGKNIDNAIKALSRKGNIEAIKHLMKSFHGKSFEIKQSIISALGIIESDEAIEHLLHISVIEDKKEMLVNIEKSLKMIAIHNQESYPVKLYNNTKKPNIFLKDAALIVLESLGINNMFDSLVDLINSDIDEQGKKNAINLLCKSKKPEHISFILQIIENNEYSSDIREFTFDRVMK